MGPMVSLLDILTLLGAVAVAVLLVVAVRWRRKDHAQNLRQLADAEVCAHLLPAYEWLTSRGHVVLRIGQKGPDMPLEVHMGPPPGAGEPPFDPKRVYDELKLGEPVFVSERNVLYCKEDWCELQPKRA
jgi:hypothetical protein